MARLGIAFLLPSLIGLALLGRLEALVVVPVEFAALRTVLPALASGDAALGAIVGAGIGGAVLAFRRGRAPPVGEVAAMLPRNRAELVYGAALSVMAGVAEEPFFRLLLPLLIALVTWSALAGFAIATLLFGAMHLYQGRRGMAGATLVGAVMAGVYLTTGALWVAVVLHVAIDLVAMVVRPVLAGAARVSS